MVQARAAAGVLFVESMEGARVLMVVPSYKATLEIPGGGVEPGETPHAAARREVQEELGIGPPVGRLLTADWWSDSPDGIGGAKALFVFNGGVLAPSHQERIAVDGDEIEAYAFLNLEELAPRTTPRLANRVRHALNAWRSGITTYLENGRIVGEVPAGMVPYSGVSCSSAGSPADDLRGSTFS